ncbi:MAG: 4Fe-4S dicluster domain-containing protein [Thermodesulfobacteriota bacterium]
MNPTGKKMVVVVDCCVGCHACEIACRQENNLTHETGSKWCRVITVKPRKAGDGLRADYLPTLCLHCDEPLCLQSCPAGAITKRADGLVLVDAERCDGCRLCVCACPYGAMSFNEVTQAAGKCNFCLERSESGIEPSCVQHCLGGALRYVGTEELDEITRGKHTAFFGRVCYVSSLWKLFSPSNNERRQK